MSRDQKGNCYAATEALYHILGGHGSGWYPMVMRVRGGTHWYLKHELGTILDPSVRQFREVPDYRKGRGCGFLTKAPSKAAQALISALTWKGGTR